MSALVQIEAGDRELLRRVAEAMADSTSRSGAWVVCRPGCTQCCYGPFAISALDVLRLRRGLADLARTDPARAQRLHERTSAYVEAISPHYPGDPNTGELFDEDELPEAMDNVACPALDPDTGCCDLYASRPMTCRAFGAATRVEDSSVAACELCYVGTSDEQIAACAVEVDPEGLEAQLLDALAAAGRDETTIVAYALARYPE